MALFMSDIAYPSGAQSFNNQDKKNNHSKSVYNNYFKS